MLTSLVLVFCVLHTHSVPTWIKTVQFHEDEELLPHLVLRVDEGVIDALGAVAEVEDGVDLLSTVERLGGSNLTHALRRDVFTICLSQNICTQIIYLEFQLGENHAAGGHTVDVDFLIPKHFGFISQQLGSTPNLVTNLCSPLEAKDVKGFVHDLHLLDIVDGVHLDLAQAAGRIVCAKGAREIVKQSQFTNKVKLSNKSRPEIDISVSKLPGTPRF